MGAQMGRAMYIGAAAGGSALLLAGALAFQYFGGLLPCALCLWQRWPHLAAVVLGALALAQPGNRAWPMLGALAALSTAAIGGYHVGVEQQWWAGLASCSTDTLAGTSVDDLLSFEQGIAETVRCDAVPWQFLGLSMAGWNAALSLALTGLWLRATLAPSTPSRSRA
jgi:disulfide bond formation protein DsbB